MVRYFYAWTPLALVVGAAVLLSIPWLALAAFTIVVLAALAAPGWAIVWAPLELSRAVGRRVSPVQPMVRRGHVS